MPVTLQNVNNSKKNKPPTLVGYSSMHFNQYYVVNTMSEWFANDNLVFLAIKQSVDAGSPRVSTSDLVKSTGFSRPTVIGARRRLKKAGALTWTTLQESVGRYHRTHFYYQINPVFYRDDVAALVNDYLWDITCKVRVLGKKLTHRKKSHLIWPLPEFNLHESVSFTRYNKTRGIDLFSSDIWTRGVKKRESRPTLVDLFSPPSKNNNKNYYCLQHEGREFLARCCCPKETTSERDLKQDYAWLDGFDDAILDPVVCSSSSKSFTMKQERSMKNISEREFKNPLQLLQKKLGITNKGLAYLSIYPPDVIEQALASGLRAGQLNNPYTYIKLACSKIAASMSYTIKQDNLLELRKHYDIPEDMPFNIPNFKQHQERQREKEIDYRPGYSREYEAAQLIEKMRAMEPAEAALQFRAVKATGLLHLLVDEWPEDLQLLIDRV